MRIKTGIVVPSIVANIFKVVDKTLKDERAYDQCQNCTHRKSEVNNTLDCRSQGILKIDELKKIKHCAAQQMMYWPNTQTPQN